MQMSPFYNYSGDIYNKKEGEFMKTKTKTLTLMALFAALTAVFSQIIIPLPFTPLPINLATLSVLLCGATLSPLYAMGSMGVYLLIGAVGMPVFSGFASGPAAIVGPTGGYLVGYIVMAGLVSLLRIRLPIRSHAVSLITAGICGTIALYTLGTAWFVILTGKGLAVALMMCVVPFLIGDSLKIAVTVLVAGRLKAFQRLGNR